MEHRTSLDTLDVLNKNTIVLELPDGHSHGNRDCQWETFWDGNNKKHDGGDDDFAECEEGLAGEHRLLLVEYNTPEQEYSVGDNAKNSGKNGELPDLPCSPFEFGFQCGRLFADDEVSWFSVPRHERVDSDAENHGFTLTGEDLGISEKERVWMLLVVVWLLVFFGIQKGFFLRDESLFGHAVEALIDFHVHLLKQEAIGGDTIPLLEVDNVTDDELSDRNGNACAVGAPVNCYLLAVHLILELQELLLLFPVTARGNEGCEENTTEDCEGLNVRLGRCRGEHGK